MIDKQARVFGLFGKGYDKAKEFLGSAELNKAVNYMPEQFEKLVHRLITKPVGDTGLRGPRFSMGSNPSDLIGSGGKLVRKWADQVYNQANPQRYTRDAVGYGLNEANRILSEAGEAPLVDISKIPGILEKLDNTRAYTATELADVLPSDVYGRLSPAFKKPQLDLDDVNEMLRARNPDSPGLTLDLLDTLRNLSDRVVKSDDFNPYERTGLDKDDVATMSDWFRANAFADPGGAFKGPSTAKTLGHIAQGGLAGSTLITLPYVANRLKQLRREKKRYNKIYGKKKKASLEKSALRNPFGTSTKELLEGKFKPAWHNYPEITWPLFVMAGLGSMAAGRNLTTSTTDAYSDYVMNKLLKKRRAKLTEKMVKARMPAEEKSASVKVSSDEPKPDKDSLPSFMLFPALAALWTFLSPSFYRLGEGLGKDTTEAAQYDKFRNALDKYDAMQPHRVKFRTSVDGKFNESVGRFLGEQFVELPVPQRGDAGGSASTSRKRPSVSPRSELASLLME